MRLSDIPITVQVRTGLLTRQLEDLRCRFEAAELELSEEVVVILKEWLASLIDTQIE